MRLQPGDLAPLFSMKDIYGNPVSLEWHRGSKIHLSFHRYGACPFCNLRVYVLKQQHALYRKRGLVIISFFHSPQEEVLKYAGTQAPPFPLIADPEQTVYRQYGVERSVAGVVKGMFRVGQLVQAYRRGFGMKTTRESLVGMPAEFLIGADMKVERVHYGSDMGDHLHLHEIEEWLSQGHGKKMAHGAPVLQPSN